MLQNCSDALVLHLFSITEIKIPSMSIPLIALLKELYKESRGGALDGPIRKSSAATN
jgi:hypothetical protein